MTLLEAAKQALDALENDPAQLNAINNAKTFLKWAIENESRIVRECKETMADLEQAKKQEPVAWVYKCGGDVQINTLPPECYGGNWTRTPLYTAPPQREWVGLTDKDMETLFLKEDWVRFARYIETKLKKKNT